MWKPQAEIKFNFIFTYLANPQNEIRKTELTYYYLICVYVCVHHIIDDHQ